MFVYKDTKKYNASALLVRTRSERRERLFYLEKLPYPTLNHHDHQGELSSP